MYRKILNILSTEESIIDAMDYLVKKIPEDSENIAAIFKKSINFYNKFKRGKLNLN